MNNKTNEGGEKGNKIYQKKAADNSIIIKKSFLLCKNTEQIKKNKLIYMKEIMSNSHIY